MLYDLVGGVPLIITSKFYIRRTVNPSIMRVESVARGVVKLIVKVIFILATVVNTGCDSGVDVERRTQIKKWGDEIDKKGGIIPADRNAAVFDSLMKMLGAVSVNDKVEYYKIMRMIYKRDPSVRGKATLYTDTLVQMFSDPSMQEKYPKDYSDVLLFKGEELFNRKDYYNAYFDYFVGKSLLDKLGDVCEAAKFTSRIANIFFNEGKFYNAIEYWKKELKELESCSADKNTFELAFIEKQGSFNNIGICYLSVNEPDSALVYFDKAMAFIDANEKDHLEEQKFIKYARMVVQIYQAEAYIAKGQISEAEELLKNSLYHDQEIDWSMGMERGARLRLATLYIYKQDYKLASEQLDVLVKDYKSLEIDEVKHVRELQAIVDLGLGKFVQAREALLEAWKSDHVNVRILNREQKSDIGRFIEHFQYETDLKIANEQNSRQRILLLLFAVTVVSLGAITYLTFKGMKKNKQHLESLAALNETIAYRNDLLQNTVDALGEEHRNNLTIMRVVAHDLRNPIGSMISASYLVFMDTTPSADQTQMIEIIQKSGRKAVTLIEDLLFSHSEEKVLVKTPLELDGLILSCIDMVQDKAVQKQQNIVFVPSGVLVNADKKIWRVFSNLIGNSIKFTPIGGEINIGVEKLPGKVVLSVKDNGIGIPDEIKDDIFDLTPTKGRDGTSGEKSFGLGLYSCKEIIEAHQGNIWFESTNGEGTTFYIELPLV